MEEGDFYYAENNVVNEGSEVVDQEVMIDYSDDEHQMFDEMPIRGRNFYFIKVLPLKNTEIDSMIKKAEEMIENVNREQVLIARKIRGRMIDLDAKRLRWKYYGNYELHLKWQREKLDILLQSLDKLTFANNAYREKAVNSCLSEGEVDKQKLSFLMVHGCKNMTDERKLLREVNASQGMDGGMTLDELEAPILHLRRKFPIDYMRHTNTDEDTRRQAILKDIRKHEFIRERAIANAVVNGKLWNSLSSKKSIQEELQVLNKESYRLRESQREVNVKIRKVNKELEKIENDICSLQKLYTDANHKKDCAYNTILRLKKQYGEENAYYYQYRSLMKKVQKLAKKKDIAAIQELSQIQVEEFMQQWNDSPDFRIVYKKRVILTLNNRQLGVDGRMIINHKPEVEDSKKVITPEALSKTRLKWLMKDLEDPSELLFLVQLIG